MKLPVSRLIYTLMAHHLITALMKPGIRRTYDIMADQFEAMSLCISLSFTAENPSLLQIPIVNSQRRGFFPKSRRQSRGTGGAGRPASTSERIG